MESKEKHGLVGLTPEVNFTNILQAAFMRADPKSAKKLLNWTVFFALLGSGQVKTVGEIDPRSQFHLNFKSSFSADFRLPKNY